LVLAVRQYRQICVVALILFLIPATRFQVQFVDFLKNLSMIGGLLFIASMSSATHDPSLSPAVRGRMLFQHGNQTLRFRRWHRRAN
jgi:hypothetical protein